MAQRIGPTGRLESRALLLRRPPARDLDFLRPTQLEHGAPRIPGFCPVGFVWNSLDSLVRNEPFQWVTRDPRPIFNSRGPSPRSGRRRPGRPSIRRSTALTPLGPVETAGRAGIMAIDIARVGPGIGMKLTLSSLFGKKLSTQRPFAPKPSPPQTRVASSNGSNGMTSPSTEAGSTWSNPNSPPLHPAPRPPHPR